MSSIPQKWKWLFTAFCLLLTLYVISPSLIQLSPSLDEAVQKNSFLTGLLPEKGVSLGLDLQGGLYLEMEVDLKEAFKNRLDILSIEIERLSENKFPGLKLDNTGDSLEVTLPQGGIDGLQAFLNENFGDVFDRAKMADSGKFVLKMTAKYFGHLREMTLKQAIEAVRNRVDRYGVAEASIQMQGEDRIIIELPGIKDPDRVIDLIRKTGLLQFRLLDESVTREELAKRVADARLASKIEEGFTKEIAEKINAALKGKIPDDSEVVYQIQRDPVTKQVVNGEPMLVKKKADVSGDMLRNAQVGISDNEPHVSLSFNKIGARNFGDVTKNNVGKRLAIILDGFVTTAPVIQNAIMNGEAQITLGFGNYQDLIKEAEDLSLLLREGALPASLKVATKTVIGPSLGKESIEKGLHSMMMASLVIIVFMILYYKLGGIFASVALCLNLLFIFGLLSVLHASLTLPGIAGIVLTMGMAVDANIIIFERMREEIRMGRDAKAIVKGGYEHAMSAIVDSNLTTLISGVVLFQFGTGPIKGFATTLMIGIITTMFTAIVFTRMIYDYLIFEKNIKKISI